MALYKTEVLFEDKMRAKSEGNKIKSSDPVSLQYTLLVVTVA